MIIINATKSVKSIMTDNGTLVTIQPGGQSELMIATKNVILAAINMGTPTEIGVVVSGSYELDIIKNISGAIPYLYTDLKEAQSKLIDPNIDYKSSLEVKNADAKFQQTLNQKDSKIKDLEDQIVTLKKELEEARSTERVESLEKSVSKLESDKTELQKENTRLKANVEDLNEQIRLNTDTMNSLRKSLGAKEQDSTAKDSLIEDLNKKIKQFELDIKKSSESSDRVTELEKVEADLKNQLAESVNTIENMKKTFNGACQKFGLYLDDQGEWQQQQLQ